MEAIKELISKEEIASKIKTLANELNEIYAKEEVYLICVLKGSVLFAADLSKHLRMPLKMEFIRLSSYGSGTYSSGKVRALDLTLPDLNNKNILIVEDIVDTGRTAKFLIDYMKNNFQAKSIKLCTLLNKKSARVEDIDADYSLFDIEDKFVVGYGLDLDGLYRNLPFVGYIE